MRLWTLPWALVLVTSFGLPAWAQSSAEPLPHYCMGCNFAGAQLAARDFSGDVLVGANFAGAQLSGASFHGAKIVAANFQSADLRRVTFDGAECTACNFQEYRAVFRGGRRTWRRCRRCQRR